MVTIQDIADRLGISVSTVSKGLNGGKDISEALRQQVLDTAVEMGYTSKRKARINKRIAFFIENMSCEKEDDFGYEILLGFQQGAFQRKDVVDIIPITPEFQQEIRYDNYMLENDYAGSFLLGLALNDPWMSQFRDTSFPTLLLDNFIPVNAKLAYVGTDSEEGIELAISHLISLGHEKIAFLNGSKDSMISDQRMRAYLHSMNKYHLPIDPNLAVYGYYVADAAKYHVPSFLDAGVTAILCGNDNIAEGVIKCVNDAGFKVPEDISVVGFDDLPFASELNPPLTTIRQNRGGLGKCAFFILEGLISNIPASKVLLRPTLVTRGSTAIAKPRIALRRTDSMDSVLRVNPRLYEENLKEQL